MTRNLPATLLVLCISLFPVAPSFAGTPTTPTSPNPTSSTGLLAFADALLEVGESYRAATEYMRVVHHYGDKDDRVLERALTGLGGAYVAAGRWDDAVDAYIQLYKLFPSGETRLKLGSALYKAGKNKEAATLLLYDGGDNKAHTIGTLAWLRQEGEKGAPDDLPKNAVAQVVAEARDVDSKSPALAGVLSAMIPGAGHLYVDRPHDALITFIINGLFIWGTVEAVDKEEWGIAAVLGAAELFWYSGGITGAANGAAKWNEREQGYFERRHEASALPRWTFLAGKDSFGLALGVKW